MFPGALLHVRVAGKDFVGPQDGEAGLHAAANLGFVQKVSGVGVVGTPVFGVVVDQRDPGVAGRQGGLMTVRDVVEAQGACCLFDAGKGLGQGGCIVQGVMQQVGLPGFHGGEAAVRWRCGW